MITRVERFVDRAFLQAEDPTALGLCRILIASILTLSLMTHVGSVADYFSVESELFGRFAAEAFPSRWSLFFYVDDPWAVRAIFALGLVAHVAWVLGLYTRLSGALSFGLWMSMVGRNPLLYSLADQLQMALCLLLAVLPAGRGLSLDASWRGKGGPVPVWCRRIIQVQIATVYVTTGLLKSGVTWRDGTALYYSLVNPYNRHFDIAPFLAAIQPWLLRPMTWLVLVWEVGFGGFAVVHWIREMLGRPRRLPDLRKPFLGFGIAMHVGIQTMMYVVWFSPLAIASYSAFLSPDEARKLLRFIARARRRSGYDADRAAPAASP